MRIRIAAQTLEWLYDNRIFFVGYRDHGFRLTLGSFLSYAQNGVIEPYCAIYQGDQIPAIGSFTYTHSAIPVGFSLGRYCSVAWGVKFPGPRHPLELLSTGGFMIGSTADMWETYLTDNGETFSNLQPNPQKPGTVIGNDVWIGQDVTIMSGLTIGNGAAIAASSVIVKDVPPYAIVGGNPAQFIRWRFPEDIRAELEQLRWWRFGFGAFNRLDLSDIRNSIRDLRLLVDDLPVFAPKPVDFTQMPHAGIV